MSDEKHSPTPEREWIESIKRAGDHSNWQRLHYCAESLGGMIASLRTELAQKQKELEGLRATPPASDTRRQ
jgi:hypothetical protein